MVAGLMNGVNRIACLFGYVWCHVLKVAEIYVRSDEKKGDSIGLSAYHQRFVYL